MRGRATLLIALAAAPLLSGCVALAIPVLAMGTMGVSSRDRIRDAREARFAERLARDAEAEAATALTDAAIANTSAPDAPPAASPGLAAIEAMAGPSRYAAFSQFALDRMQRRTGGEALTSMVTVDNVDVSRPAFIPCDDKPPAVVIDIDDGTAGPDPMLADTTTPARFTAEPGLAAELVRLRAAGIAVLWLSDHGFESDYAVYARLQASGLDSAGRDPLYAQMAPGDRKQGRRQEVAGRYCVLAVAGDKRSDAEEAYDYLLRPELAAPLEPLWNNGWFILPLPLRAVPADPTPAAPAQP